MLHWEAPTANVLEVNAGGERREGDWWGLQGQVPVRCYSVGTHQDTGKKNQTGFQCAALTVLELMLFDKLALNSVMPLPLPPESWD